MLIVILIWLYVIITTYLTGYALLKTLSSWRCMSIPKDNGSYKIYKNHYHESYIVAGIVFVTVYAQIISLFHSVGLMANIILVMICIVAAVYYRDELREDLSILSSAMGAKWNGICYILIFLLMAYGTSHGIMHYDTDLYHAQAIHWIEQYGVIKGLGNLHVRLAYNSSSFVLSALYSMSFFGKGSYHVMAGFFALLLAWQCLDIKNVVRRGHIILSDFARIAAIYYLFTVFDEMVSPASDYFLSTIVFYVIIHWLDMYVRHEKSYVAYIELSLLAVYAVTIKLSAAPMVLLSIIPVYKLFHNRTKEKVKAFWLSVLMIIAICVPFFIRNVIISGWLIYPVTVIDLFGFNWEIPKGLAEYDSLEIRTFGHGYNDPALYGNLSMSEWVPHWFGELSLLNKAMIIMSIAAIVAYIISVIYFVIVAYQRKTHKFKNTGATKIFNLSSRSMLNMADFLTLSGTLICCLGFWFLSAPLIRYGVVYVWLTVTIVFGRLFLVVYNRIPNNYKDIIFKMFVGVLALWLVYKGVNIALEDSQRFNARYFITQQDYGHYDTNTFELGNTTFYYPQEGDQVGYDPFPAATHDVSGEIEFIGNDITDGFKSISE